MADTQCIKCAGRGGSLMCSLSDEKRKHNVGDREVDVRAFENPQWASVVSPHDLPGSTSPTSTLNPT